MAILMRRGLYKNFDAAKMLPGEWAVSIDNDKQKQIVWMCFAAGIVKRMGTYEDFKMQIEDATDDIRESYETVFNEIKASMQILKSQTEGFKNTAATKAFEASESAREAEISSDIAATKAFEASESAREAEISSNSAIEKAYESNASAILSKSYAVGETGSRYGEESDNSKYYSNASKSSADTSKEYLKKVEDAGNEAIQKIKDALNENLPNFQIDLSTGHLMYEGGRFLFNINSLGHLEWGLAI